MPVRSLMESIAPATEPNEKRIFWISVYYSLIHLGLMVHAFLTGHHPPSNALIFIHSIFVGLLYAVPKEYERWMNGGSKRPPKPGHVMVVLWFSLFLSMCVAEYFSDGAVKLPDGMTEMTSILVGTIGATSLSKLMYATTHPCTGTACEKDVQEAEKTGTP